MIDRVRIGVVLEVVVVMSIVFFAGVFFYSGDDEIDETSKVANTEMNDTDLSLALASYPNMVNYTSNKTTKGNPNDHFIETDDGKLHYIEINRYWFRKPDLTTNDSEAIKEGTILYDQYEESLAIIEGLQE